MLVYIPTIKQDAQLEKCVNSIYKAIPNPLIVFVKEGNVGEARTAMCKTKEPFFCMVDSDIILPENWYTEISKLMTAKVGAVFSKKLTNIYLLQEFEEYCYSKQTYPAVNTGRLDTAAALFRTEAVKGFQTNLRSLEDLLLGEYIISKGYSHIQADVTVKHIGYGGTMKGYYKALQKDGESLRKMKRTSLLKMFASIFVMPLKTRKFKLLILKYRINLFLGYIK